MRTVPEGSLGSWRGERSLSKVLKPPTGHEEAKLRDLQERLRFHSRAGIDQDRHRKGHFTAVMSPPPIPPAPLVMASVKANVADESVVVSIGFPSQDSLRTLERNFLLESPPRPSSGHRSPLIS